MAGQTIQVSVLADTKKFSRAMRGLSRETGIDKLGNAFKSAGRKIVGVLKSAVKWTGIFAGVIGAMAIKGGISRALDSEDARIMLDHFNVSMEDTDRILKTVNDTFATTPFAAPEGQKFAAQLIAGGREVDDVLKDIQTTSDIAALSMDKQFGPVSDMLVKISANGRVTATDLNSIALMGIPIKNILAEGLGVSVDELNKMVSAGDLSYDALMDVLSGSEELAGASEALEASTRVAWSSMLSWFSIVGEALVTDLLPVFQNVFKGIAGWLEDATDVAAVWGKAIAHWFEDVAIPAVKRFGGWLANDLWPVLQKVGGEIGGAFTTAIDTVKGALDDAGISGGDLADTFSENLLGAIEAVGDVIAWVIKKTGDMVAFFIAHKDTILTFAASVGGVVAAFVTFKKVTGIIKAVQAAWIVLNGVFAASPIGLLLLGIAALVAGLVWFFTQTELGQAIVATAWQAIQDAIAVVVDWYEEYAAPVVEAVAARLADAWDWLSEKAADAWAWIQEKAAEVADWYQEYLAPMFEAAGGLIAEVWDILKEKGAELWEALAPYFEAIALGWAAMWALIKEVWDIFGPVITANVVTAFEGMALGVSLAWEGMMAAIEIALTLITGILNFWTAVLQGDWSTAWGVIKDTTSDIWGIIEDRSDNAMGKVAKFVGDGLARLQAAWGETWDRIKTKLQTVWNTIVNWVSTKIATVQTVITRTLAAIRLAWNVAWMYLKARVSAIWEGIKEGVRNGVGDVLRTLAGLPGTIMSLFGSAGGWLIGAGKAILGGLLAGLVSAWTAVASFLGGLGAKIKSLKGPEEYDRNLLVPAGEWIMGGLQVGLRAQIPALRRTLDDVAGEVAGTRFEPLMVPSGDDGTGVLNAGSGAGSGAGPDVVARMDRGDLDYLIGGIVSGLWPTARAADVVGDFARRGQSRQRMGNVRHA